MESADLLSGSAVTLPFTVPSTWQPPVKCRSPLIRVFAPTSVSTTVCLRCFRPSMYISSALTRRPGETFFDARNRARSRLYLDVHALWREAVRQHDLPVEILKITKRKCPCSVGLIG